MGRNKKYETKEELRAAQRKWRLDYYYRNHERCKQERMRRYFEVERPRVCPKISGRISGKAQAEGKKISS